jgi:hypothetical protein
MDSMKTIMKKLLMGLSMLQERSLSEKRDLIVINY